MKKGFTLVELLTVLAIIMLLIGFLMPATVVMRKFARNTKQKAQLATIGLGLTAFRNDDGDYPPSSCDPPQDYCGSQKLAEALLGRDLLGFHPQSIWDAAGTAYIPPNEANLKARQGPYIELGTSNAFRLGDSEQGDGLFVNASAFLDPDSFVLCDAFGVRELAVSPRKKVKAGTPILYYRANTSSRIFNALSPNTSIYNFDDNARLLILGTVADPSRTHTLYDIATFYNYLEDWKATNASGVRWPYRPDSYILISAGADGRYGTSDDITNF